MQGSSRTHFTILLAVLLMAGCRQVKPVVNPYTKPSSPLITSDLPPNHAEVVTFYGLGDWGTGDSLQKAIAIALGQNIRDIPKGRTVRPFVLGLGDLIYTHGLLRGWVYRDSAVTKLEKTFGTKYASIRYGHSETDSASVDFYVVAGNHDYDDHGILSKKKNWGDVFHLETTAEHEYDNFHYYPIQHISFRDSDDSTEYKALSSEMTRDIHLPETIDIGAPAGTDPPITIIALDTQRLLRLNRKIRKADNSEDKTKYKNFFQQHLDSLEVFLQQAQDEGNWPVVIGHHPVRTHGPHGSWRTWEDWLLNGFPILYSVPRSLVAYFFRKPQDTDHVDYRSMIDSLTTNQNGPGILQKYCAIYVAGHEHSLQLLEIDGTTYQIVSGSAAKLSKVDHHGDTHFSHQAYGFVRFDVTKDDMWIRFYAVDVTTPDNPTYRVTETFRITKPTLECR